MTEQKNTGRPRGTDSAKVIRVIETRGLCGRGTEDDPCRTLIQYWDLDGNLLAVNDTHFLGGTDNAFSNTSSDSI